jgi:hypothetical protein
MAEPKYFIQFHLNGDFASVELKTLEDNRILSKIELEWAPIDELNASKTLDLLQEQAINAVRQCVVSANAAPGKIAEIQIIPNEEPFFFALNSNNPANSVVICNFDSFDEQLQECIDFVKLNHKKSISAYCFLPLHSWVAHQFSSDKNRFFMSNEQAEKSIFFHTENMTWHKGAFEALKIKAHQLPLIKKAGEMISSNEIGLVTSVAEINIKFQ